ncbi:MAG: GFA family protein [Deltaproteobacteria bacterium]|nr:GFA family protein [Deltaproteobacteria bacterium]MBI3391529.1 GFA family protein [Deltaproteobacteria bacterium]
MNKSHVEGGCLCGSIRYQGEGEPSNLTLYHCRSCRKATGSPIIAWVTFPASGFSFVSGTPTEYRSSPKVVRAFCAACGTPLTYRHANYPSSVDVTTCSLDDPESFAPTDHTFFSHRLRWLRVNDHLPARSDRS